MFFLPKAAQRIPHNLCKISAWSAQSFCCHSRKTHGGCINHLCGRGLKCHQTESKRGTRRVDHDYVDLRLKLYQNTEFDGIQSGPQKFESVVGEIYLAPDAKVSCVWSNGLQHRKLPPELCQNNELMEFERVRQNPNLLPTTSTWLLTPRYRA